MSESKGKLSRFNMHENTLHIKIYIRRYTNPWGKQREDARSY